MVRSIFNPPAYDLSILLMNPEYDAALNLFDELKAVRFSMASRIFHSYDADLRTAKDFVDEWWETVRRKTYERLLAGGLSPTDEEVSCLSCLSDFGLAQVKDWPEMVLWHEYSKVAQVCFDRFITTPHDIPESDAASRFKQDFPHGYEVVPTSGEGFLCGINAIVNTLKYNHPKLRRPTANELLKLYQSEEFQMGMNEFLIIEAANDEDAGIYMDENENHFRIDQLARLVNTWGQKQKPPVNLSLGTVEEGKEGSQMIMPWEPSNTVIWIHNDGNEIVEDGALIQVAHWSGLRRDRWL